ncbi:MAG: hypothetical protein QXM76_04535 [Zestosphaera sp.]
MGSEVSRLKIREARLEDNRLILAGKGFEKVLNVEEIRRVGVEKSFNKMLVLLTSAVAVLTVFSQDLPHLVTLVIMLLITTAYREESIVLEFKAGSVIKARGMTSKEVRRVVKTLLSKDFTRL